MHYGSQAEKQLFKFMAQATFKSSYLYIGGQESLFLVKIDVGK